MNTVQLLPTPTVSEANGTGPADSPRNDSLRAQVALLPTPTATPYGNNQSPSPGAAVRPSLDSLAPTLLPTPTASFPGTTANYRPDGTPYGTGYGMTLLDAARLLPTPVAADSDRESDSYSRGNPTLKGALLPTPRATDGSKGGAEPAGFEGGPNTPLGGTSAWGPYAAAVARWECVLGRAAPGPTDALGRLNPAFVEWMQGVTPAGRVTAVPGVPRSAQLKALGNGVVKQQAAAALRLLLDRLPHPISSPEEF